VESQIKFTVQDDDMPLTRNLISGSMKGYKTMRIDCWNYIHMAFIWKFLLVLKVVAGSSLLEGLQERPPSPKFGYNEEAFDQVMEPRMDEEDYEDEGFEWEKSGLFEGDIMTYEDDERNGVLSTDLKWHNATIPFYIEEDHFSDEEIRVILSAVREFHKKTCVRFRPYKVSDDNWLFITGDKNGCWSSVGMIGTGGQQLNLHVPKCVRKGVAIHEMLHACGFLHQQSTHNRDDYVRILFENISEGHQSNFDKYNSSVVTDYGSDYDFESIMHYSSKAFSKNGNKTIVAHNETITKLGQRDGFTKTDVFKLNKMYESTCHAPEPVSIDSLEDELTDFAGWFQSLIN